MLPEYEPRLTELSVLVQARPCMVRGMKRKASADFPG
jgi:hypothetical protein